MTSTRLTPSACRLLGLERNAESAGALRRATFLHLQLVGAQHEQAKLGSMDGWLLGDWSGALLGGEPLFACVLSMGRIGPSGHAGPWLMTLWGLGLALVVAAAVRLVRRLKDRSGASSRFGVYAIEEQVGEGGFGVVYLARDRTRGRLAAIKMLRAEHRGAEAAESFAREVMHASRLSHPNAVEIYDYGDTPDGEPYCAMEYLDGPSLDELVAREGSLSPRRAAALLAQIASVLDQAHRLGLVHRDIKPANVIVCQDADGSDRVKLIDFGLALDRTQPEAPTERRRDVIEGTPLYLAPESITAGEVDGRADLYALGALGYVLLTGQPPFEGRTVVEICSHHLHSAPRPLAEVRGDVPRELEELLLACLAKRPEDRPASAAAVERTLLRCAESPGAVHAAAVEDREPASARRWWPFGTMADVDLGLALTLRVAAGVVGGVV